MVALFLEFRSQRLCTRAGEPWEVMLTTRVDLMKGTLGLLLLKAVSGKRRHGQEIVSWLHARTDGALLVEEGALYPALHRLEERHLVASEWRRTANNRRARYYSLTPKGFDHMRGESRRWDAYHHAMHKVLTSS